MKILMLTPYLPYPPASGGQIRTLNLLKYLSKNHEITLIALYKNAQEKQYASHLKPYCKSVYLCKRAEKPWQLKNVLRSIFSLTPFLIVRNYSEEAHNKVAELLSSEHFDVIHAETFYIMPHIPQTDIPTLLVEQTIEFKVYLHYVSNLPVYIRPAFFLDILKLRRSEIYHWKKASAVATVSEYDRQTIQRHVPSLTPALIPNGAGDEMFVSLQKKNSSRIPKLLFIGNFSWLQNTEAALYLLEQIYPVLIKQIPELRIIIGGQRAQERLQSYANEHIQIVDVAPDDTETIKRLYHEATLFIGPVFGPGGTNLKLLAAMASGLPIVSSTIGAKRLGMKDREDVWMADDPYAFVHGIVTLLKDRKIYNRIRTQAYKLAESKYSWSAISKELETVYREIRKNHEYRH